MKQVARFLMLLTLFIPGIGLALVCDAPTATETARVYFVNGMNNTADEIERSSDRLERLIGGGNATSFGSSINNKEGILEQLLEVYGQRESEVSHFWEWLNDLSIAPQWFQDSFHAQMTTIANLAVYQDLDLRIMVEEYLQDLRSGKKVVLVSHSQGNFYANNAYQFIKDTTDYASGAANSIGIVAVGTPSGRVQDGGAHTTNTLDLIVNLVRLGYYVLPANMTYDEPNSHTNHSFVNTYLTAAGNKIKADVYNTISRLQAPPLKDECKPGTITTRGSSSISSNNASLSANVTSGKNIDVWFNVRKDANPVSCSSTAGSYDGQGSASQGQIIYGWANNYITLQPNARYYFRACGKNDPGDVSQGAVKNFRTKNAVATKVTTSNATSITRTSATLKGHITDGNSIDTWFSPVSTNSSNAVCAGNPDGIGSGDTGESISKAVSGLNPGTTYYYRFCGKGYDGLKSGVLKSFKTQVIDTEVKTLSAKSVDETTATIRGEIVGGDNINYWWVRSTDSSNTSCSAGTREGSGYGNTGDIKTLALSDLSGSKTYYYRFCGEGQDGTDDGYQKSFTTDEIIIACGDSYQGSSEGLTVTLVKTNSRLDVAYVSFEAYTIPDGLDMYYSDPGGSGHSSTHGLISGHMNFQLPFNGQIKFYVTGNSDQNTQWDLDISCYDSSPF